MTKPPSPADAMNAVKTAVAMQKRLITLNQELHADGLEQVAVGIGLHTGVATIGYIGSDRRSESMDSRTSLRACCRRRSRSVRMPGLYRRSTFPSRSSQ